MRSPFSARNRLAIAVVHVFALRAAITRSQRQRTNE